MIIDTQTLDETNADSETALQEEVDDSRLYASCYSAQGIISITFENHASEGFASGMWEYR